MRKKLVSMAVLLAFLLAMLPSVALADDTAPVSDAQIHDVSELKNYSNADTLSRSFYYGGIECLIIAYDGEGVLDASGQVTLITRNTLGGIQFGSTNNYSESNLKTRMDGLATDGRFSEIERGAIAPRTLEASGYPDGIKGDAVENALLWPLSVTEANKLAKSLRTPTGTSWWLRTPGYHPLIDTVAFMNNTSNSVYESGNKPSGSSSFGVRPAFNIKLDSVLFVTNDGSN